MASLVEVLRRIPFFASLPRGSLAKVIADLAEEKHSAGAVLCYEGAPARDFFIVRSGTVAVLVNQGGGRREAVATLGPGQWFGERALFAESPRAATVVAKEPVVVWRLSKEKFDSLLEENPWVVRHLTEVLSDRLYQANRELAEWQRNWANHVRHWLKQQSPEVQHYALCLSLLPSLTLNGDAIGLLGQIAGSPPLDFFGQIERAGFVNKAANEPALYPGTHAVLLQEAKQRWGDDEIACRRRELAIRAERSGLGNLAAHLYATGDNLADSEREARLALARTEASVVPNRLAPQTRGPAGTVVLEDPVAGLGGGADRSSAGEARNDLPATVITETNRSWLSILLAVAVASAGWFLPAPSGLSPEALKMLTILAAAALLWMVEALPDYVVALAMLLAWVVFQVVPAEVAVSGFTKDTFFLIVGVLGVGASLQASGLLFRLALQVLRRFPLSHRGQCLGLTLSGTCMAPAVPDVTSGVAIASPIVLALSDSLGYGRRSNGSAGLAMAALLGFGQMSPFFLTGAAENLVAWSLLPEAARARVGWLTWLVGGGVLGASTLLLGILFTWWLLPAEHPPKASSSLVLSQLEALGPMSRSEAINALVLALALIGWISSPVHGVSVGWIAMAALTTLLGFNLLDRLTFRAGIYWDFMFYLGTALSLTEVVRHLGIDQWLVTRLAPLLAPATQWPMAFYLSVACTLFVARFVLPSLPLVSLWLIGFLPISDAAGFHPLPLLLVTCTAVAIWFVPYQSPYYLALYFGTKEKAFSHRQVRAVAWSYGLTYLAGIALSVFYWRLLGWLP